MKKKLVQTILMLFIIFIVSCEKKTTEPDYNDNTVIDFDGNIYQTVQIGNQLWMAENLRVTHYRNGDAILHITQNDEWESLSTGAYGVYNNTNSNAEVYGNLYNWYAVDDNRNIAPEGWHVPTDEEIIELEMALGMSENEANECLNRGINEGSKLAGSADLWCYGDLKNNEEFGTSGFNFLPGGYRNDTNGVYDYMSYFGFLWSSSEYDDEAWMRYLHCTLTTIYRGYNYKQYGFSVRCVKDSL